MRQSLFSACGVMALLLASSVCPAADWGDLSGQFVYDGKAPAPPVIVPTKDVEVCGKKKLFDENLVVGADGGIADIVIWLNPGDAKLAIHEMYAKTATGEVELGNAGCRFEPRIGLLRTSQTLLLANHDPIAHNMKAEPRDSDPFNPLIPPNASFKVKIGTAQNLPVPVSCAIHPWMSGYVVVQDHPYMAVTDKSGKFTIKGLPAGTWTFTAWQSKSGYLKDVTVGGKKAVWKRGKFEVTIKAGANDQGAIKVDPENFNK